MQNVSSLEHHTAVPIKLNRMFGPSRDRKNSSPSMSDTSHSRSVSGSSATFIHSPTGLASFTSMLNAHNMSRAFRSPGAIESDADDGGSFIESPRNWFVDHEHKGFDEFLGNTREHVKGPANEAFKRNQILKDKMRDANKMPRPINYGNLRLRRTVREEENDEFTKIDDENTKPNESISIDDTNDVVDQTMAEPLRELDTNGLNMTPSNTSVNDTMTKDTTRNDWIDISATPGPYEKAIIQPKRRHVNKRKYSTAEKEPKQIRSFLMDPMTPGILSAYVQTVFNFGLLSIFIYFFYLIISTIRHDINQKVEEYSGDILQDMSQCSHEYVRNNCMPGKRVPALEAMCNNWERCMNQDPAVVGRAKVSAEMFAEIVNSFIEPISIKTMLFIVVLCGGAFFVNNVALSFSARKYLTLLQQENETPISHSRAISAPETSYVDNKMRIMNGRRGIRRISRKRTS